MRRNIIEMERRKGSEVLKDDMKVNEMTREEEEDQEEEEVVVKEEENKKE